jgi:hypothetical protein
MRNMTRMPLYFECAVLVSPARPLFNALTRLATFAVAGELQISLVHPMHPGMWLASNNSSFVQLQYLSILIDDQVY